MEVHTHTTDPNGGESGALPVNANRMMREGALPKRVREERISHRRPFPLPRVGRLPCKRWWLFA